MGPFSEDSLLVSWDVVAMFPNIDNNLGINAVIEALEARPARFPSTDCIVEAVQICLKHNNSLFEADNFLQIHGTAMGPKNACSYADLAMVIINRRARSGEIKPNSVVEIQGRYFLSLDTRASQTQRVYGIYQFFVPHH